MLIPLNAHLAHEILRFKQVSWSFLPKVTRQVSNCCCSVAQWCPTLCDPINAAHQASLPFTIPWSLLKLMSIESVTPSNHLVLRRPLLLLPSVFPRIRVFSNEPALHISWPKYWSFIQLQRGIIRISRLDFGILFSRLSLESRSVSLRTRFQLQLQDLEAV